MLGRISTRDFSSFLVVFLLFQSLVAAQNAKPSPWLTLSGSAPAIIARGGFSGLFPDSSSNAYNLALGSSSPDIILWCDVQLTKDGIGICLPDVKLQNCTNIPEIYPDGRKVYSVNGVQTQGWFSVDYNGTELGPVSLAQRIYSRTDKFDASLYPILGVEDVSQLKPPGLWLNVEHDIFYSQHGLSMRSYVISVSKRVIINYISSPEVGFLRGIVTRFQGSKTKLVFRFLAVGTTEPTTNQTYGSLLKNLTFIKTFASGILVPKTYIWPVTSDLYLLPHTSIVTDAHKAGLEVYAAEFANDGNIPFNYSYDPLAEYLDFVDNGVFSVDGVLTDFPITPSEAIGCYSHINKNSSGLAKPAITSHGGASGIYPPCTDLAYQQAVTDGADFIDCPVQITQDGIAICMSSINLIGVSTVTHSPFSTRVSIIPDLQSNPGIFTFNLTWEEIQKLKPTISAPELTYTLVRNPRYQNSGNFMSLSDFLAFAKDTALSGVLIDIENAAFLAERLGFSATEAVISALNDSGYSNQTTHEVVIRSSNSSVLLKFRQQTNYKLNYMVDETIRDADASSIADIKSFTHSVSISKQSIFPKTQGFTTGQTGTVKTLQSAGLEVHVYLLQNEFVSQAWDFFSDPYVEVNAFVELVGVDGIITDFPGTTKRYRRNACANMGDNKPLYMEPVQIGELIKLINVQVQPPALAPLPVLDASDVVEPPLPPVSGKPAVPPPAGGGSTTAPPPSQPSSAPKLHQCTLSSTIMLVALSFAALFLH